MDSIPGFPAFQWIALSILIYVSMNCSFSINAETMMVSDSELEKLREK